MYKFMVFKRQHTVRILAIFVGIAILFALLALSSGCLGSSSNGAQLPLNKEIEMFIDADPEAEYETNLFTSKGSVSLSLKRKHKVLSLVADYLNNRSKYRTDYIEGKVAQNFHITIATENDLIVIHFYQFGLMDVVDYKTYDIGSKQIMEIKKVFESFVEDEKSKGGDKP